MTAEAIKSILSTIPETSGVYQFFDAKEQVIYVGKAKNLLKRIQSYTRKDQLSGRIARMVFLAKKVEWIQTRSEVEALLLEHNLIKKLSPRFNILLRDDKTFPQILITGHKFPRITKFRQTSSLSREVLSKEDDPKRPSFCEKGHLSRSDKLCSEGDVCFGPYASAHDVNHAIDILRKSFLLRNCSDAEFKLRKKPCLEYQIKKCSAPCVGLISQEDYKNSVDEAIDFLSGKSVEVQKNLVQKMQRFSEVQEYEQAAAVRDKIKVLNSIQAKQNINISELGDSDVITIVAMNGVICIYISFFRGGQNCGAKPYFYETDEEDLGKILEEFLGQFYLSQSPARLILLNSELPEKDSMEKFLEKISGKSVSITIPKSGQKANLIKDQVVIALQNLEQKVLQNLGQKEIFLEIKKIFDLPKIPQRIEVYDNSHTGGTNAVGVLIAAGLEGFIKSGYRKFNIGKYAPHLSHNLPTSSTNASLNPPLTSRNLPTSSTNATTSPLDKREGVPRIREGKDDTAMLREVLTRRFSKLEKKNFPDLIIIDGGKPQLSAAYEVFSDLKIKIPFICMAKGENRNAGEEKFYRASKSGEAENVASDLSKHHPVMHYLQRLRDEAHRFAIMTHRKKRGKAMLV